MHVPQQVEDGVGDRDPAVLADEDAVRAGDTSVEMRGDAGGVDEGHAGQPAGRPADLEMVDVLARRAAEVDLERAVAPRERPCSPARRRPVESDA